MSGFKNIPPCPECGAKGVLVIANLRAVKYGDRVPEYLGILFAEPTPSIFGLAVVPFDDFDAAIADSALRDQPESTRRLFEIALRTQTSSGFFTCSRCWSHSYVQEVDADFLRHQLSKVDSFDVNTVSSLDEVTSAITRAAEGKLDPEQLAHIEKVGTKLINDILGHREPEAAVEVEDTSAELLSNLDMALLGHLAGSMENN